MRPWNDVPPYLTKKEDHRSLSDGVVEVVKAAGIVASLEALGGEVHKHFPVPLEERPDCSSAE